MPSVFRPTYHSPIYEPATYSTKKGKRYVRFRLPKSGMYVTGEVMPNGEAKLLQTTYVARIRETHEDVSIEVRVDGSKRAITKTTTKTVRVPLGVADRDVAITKAAELQLKADRRGAGLEDVDAMIRHHGTDLAEHLEDYKAHLESNGCCADHIGEAVRLIQRVMSACQFWKIEHLAAASLNRYLNGLIRKGRSYRTRNKALEHMKAFVHWMQHGDRMDRDPFRTIKALNLEADPNRRERRALTQQEFTKLITATQAGKVVQGISGPERAIIYSLVVTTGLRAKETALLTVRDLVLDTEFPYIKLPPAIAKAKREAIMPLHPFVADQLATWTKGMPRPARLFHLMTDNGVMRLTNRMMKADTKAAGISYDEGGYADFHALRTTYITNVCRLTDQFTAMKLARHTKATITARHYDKVLLSQRSNVVGQLALPAPTKPR